MLTLSLWQKAEPNSSFNFIGTKIADGADGEVFELAGYDDRVIKISIIFDHNFEDNLDLTFKYVHLSKVLDVLQSTCLNTCAHVYEYDCIGIFRRDILINNIKAPQAYLLHYYVMEKCYKLTEDEKKLFHTILSHEDRNIEKIFSIEKLKEILFGLGRGLDFDEKKVIFFYESLMESPIKHMDLHPRNIMKDKLGNYKLVDFDRLEIT